MSIDAKEIRELAFERARPVILKAVQAVIDKTGCTFDDMNRYVLPQMLPLFTAPSRFIR